MEVKEINEIHRVQREVCMHSTQGAVWEKCWGTEQNEDLKASAFIKGQGGVSKQNVRGDFTSVSECH